MSIAPLFHARCDVLAVARECVQARSRVLWARGIDVGIELPCGALPWLKLDERLLRRLLQNALDRVARLTGADGVQLALWHETADDGVPRLQVEAYADEPSASLSFELALAGGGVAEPPLPCRGGTALLVEDHPARRRILRAQLARIGLASDASAPGEPMAAAFAGGRHGFVWLGGMADVDRVALASSLRRLERGQGRARIVALRETRAGAARAPTGIDAWVDWPLSLDELRGLCLDLPREDAAVSAALFFRECLRDAAALGAALEAADWVAVVRHAHRISGGTLVLGENAVCALAERIEAIARRAAPDRAQVKRLLAELQDGLRRFAD